MFLYMITLIKQQFIELINRNCQRTYIIDTKNFQSTLLKIDKKPYKDFDICYIGYITIKKFDKFSDHENIHSMNPLYLMFKSDTGYFEEKNGEKCLIFDSTEKYEKVFSAIKSEIETINGRKKCIMKKLCKD